MRHAYLIIAHAQWDQLERLLRLLDHPDNDLYIHIDRKARDCPVDQLRAAVRSSGVEIVPAVPHLLGQLRDGRGDASAARHARKKGYGYYHLLSGMDMPTRPQAEIHAFFAQNAGKEFVEFSTDASREAQPRGRAARAAVPSVHAFSRRFRLRPLNWAFRQADRACLLVQMLLGVDRLRRFPGLEVRYGSSWFSITDELAACVLERADWIREVFRFANSADDAVFADGRAQHAVSRSPVPPGVRTAAVWPTSGWWTGSAGETAAPTPSGWRTLTRSAQGGCMFARKFSMETDRAIVDRMTELAGGAPGPSDRKSQGE